MFANVYRAMRDIGMPNPRQVDQMEMWEIAVQLGSDIDSDTPAGGDWWSDWRDPTEDELAVMAAGIGRR